MTRALSEEKMDYGGVTQEVDMLFAPPKTHPCTRRLRLRDPNGDKKKFHFAAAAQNLRKMAKLIQCRHQQLQGEP